MQAVRKSSIMLCLLLSDLTAVYAQQDSIVQVTTRAQRIHQSTFVFDGHNDLPYTLRKNASSSFTKMDIAKPQPSIHTDIPRLRKGNVGAQYW